MSTEKPNNRQRLTAKSSPFGPVDGRTATNNDVPIAVCQRSTHGEKGELRFSLKLSGQTGQATVAAEIRVAERAQTGVSHAMRQGQQQAVVRHLRILDRSAHPEIQAASHQHEGDVVERV